jgi:copper chaperone CopZ
MTHTYHITGMTCTGCQAKVQGLLSNVKHVTKVVIDLAKDQAAISMDKHIATTELQAALKDYPKYQLTEDSDGGSPADGGSPFKGGSPSEKAHHAQSEVTEPSTESEPPLEGDPLSATPSWIITYKPILLIFGYITGISLLTQVYNGHFNWMHWMNYFMAGFFLVFSFFKLLNLRGFAESYAMYDIVAKKIPAWGYVYAFVELALGLAYLLHINPLLTNGITFAVMSISIIGVLQSVLNKRKIRCACLGDVFNLPMSTITIIEDALMIAMSGIMLLTIL